MGPAHRLQLCGQGLECFACVAQVPVALCVDVEGADEFVGDLAHKGVVVVGDMFAEGFGIEGTSGCGDPGGQIADICAVLCLNGYTALGIPVTEAVG